jgi:hypothetical protein
MNIKVTARDCNNIWIESETFMITDICCNLDTGTGLSL